MFMVYLQTFVLEYHLSTRNRGHWFVNAPALIVIINSTSDHGGNNNDNRSSSLLKILLKAVKLPSFIKVVLLVCM